MLVNMLKRIQEWHDKNQDIAALPWLLFIIFAGMAILTGGRFLNTYNIKNMLAQMPELGLLSLAMMLPMVTAGINLSIISTANLSAVIMALFIKGIFPGGGFIAVIAAIAVGLAAAAFLGWLNGLLIGYVEVPAVLATLGTMILFEGVTLAITKGFVISSLPESFLLLGNARLMGIPVQMIIFVLAALAVSIMFNKRPFGVHLYFIGLSPTATKYSGINIRRVLVKTYVASGPVGRDCGCCYAGTIQFGQCPSGLILAAFHCSYLHAGGNRSVWRFWKSERAGAGHGYFAIGSKWTEHIGSSFICRCCNLGNNAHWGNDL